MEALFALVILARIGAQPTPLEFAPRDVAGDKPSIAAPTTPSAVGTPNATPTRQPVRRRFRGLA